MHARCCLTSSWFVLWCCLLSSQVHPRICMPASKCTGHIFKPIPKPAGHHPGWVFKHGHLGLGYYRDSGEVARSGRHMPRNDVACVHKGMCLMPDCTLPRADVLLVYDAGYRPFPDVHARRQVLVQPICARVSQLPSPISLAPWLFFHIGDHPWMQGQENKGEGFIVGSARRN